MKRIEVFDTTLRDGEQGIGNLMTIENKMEIANKLDFLGLDYIELGVPTESNYDHEWYYEAGKILKRTKPAVLVRPIEKDIEIALKQLRHFSNFQIQLLGIGSEIHLIHKRKISIDDAKKELNDSISFIKNNGVKNISVIFEDASRGLEDYLKIIIDAAISAGATSIVLADTVGASNPHSIYQLIRKIKKITGTDIKVSVHCHNDLGLATANTLESIRAGADGVQTTLGGIGERAGNCSLEEIVATLYYMKHHYDADTQIDKLKMVDACEDLFMLLNKKIPANKPIIGEYVFSTAAGIHQDGIIKNPKIYEFVEPEVFGKIRQFIYNRLSGSKSTQIKNQLLENLNQSAEGCAS